MDGWFLTGDIGYFDGDGFVHLVDRKKDLILSGGCNVYPQAIEQANHEHPDVAEVMVIGVPDDHRGEAAEAHVVLRRGAEGFALEALPRTSVGKYSRRMLRDETFRSRA